MSSFQYHIPTYDNDQPFTVMFSPCTREVLGLAEEVDAAARDIASEASRLNKPVWVCFSGGIDSEVVCESLHRQGIHFRVLTLEHEEGTNEYDIAYAKKWCASHHVEQKIVSLNMGKFIRTEIDQYVEAGYIANYPFRYLQLRLLEIIEGMGGYGVLGGGEHMYATETVAGKESIVLHFQTGYAAPLEWCRRRTTAHEPYFFFRTPELMRSYMTQPIVSCALEYPETFRHQANAYLLKRLVYHSTWPFMETRHKYDGFERVRDVARARRLQLEKHFGKRFSVYTLPVTVLSKQLTGDSA